MIALSLNGIDIAFIAKLHHDENPTVICMKKVVPSKVRERRTMLGWSRSLILCISCSMYFTK